MRISFSSAVRAFLKKHEFGNAGWEDLVNEFEDVSWRRPTDCMMGKEECKRIENAERQVIQHWAKLWVSLPGVFRFRVKGDENLFAGKSKFLALSKDPFNATLVTSERPYYLPSRFEYLAGFKCQVRAK